MNDSSDSRPAYQRIADELRAAIASGSLRPGDKVPSERELAQRYGAAHMTIRQAVGLLKDEGLVTTRRGIGSFVEGRPPLRHIGSNRYPRKRRLTGKKPTIGETDALVCSRSSPPVKSLSGTSRAPQRRMGPVEEYSDGRPAYQRIADELRAAIKDGSLRPGDKIPSERELARQYGTAHMTVRQAIGLLKEEGLVTTRQGVGSFVQGRPPLRRIGSNRYSRKHRLAGTTPFMADTAAVGPPTFEILRFGPTPAPPDVAERLAIGKGDLTLLTHLRFHAGAQVMQISTAYIPYTLVGETPIADPAREPWNTDTITNLETVGVLVNEVIEETTARTATSGELRDLELRPGSHVFQMTRTMLANGTPVETSDIIMPTSRYLLSYRIQVD